MEVIDAYSVGGTGPEINKSNNSKVIYFGDVPKAATMDDALDVIKELGNMVSDVEADYYDYDNLIKLKNSDYNAAMKKIDSLENEWNKCIYMNGKYNEYVKTDDISDEFSHFNFVFDNMISNVNTILNNYNSTISTINSYIDMLSKNKEDYNNLSNNINNLKSLANNCTDDISKNLYLNKINSLTNKLNNYSVISDIDGKWVVK